MSARRERVPSEGSPAVPVSVPARADWSWKHVRTRNSTFKLRATPLLFCPFPSGEPETLSAELTD